MLPQNHALHSDLTIRDVVNQTGVRLSREQIHDIGRKKRRFKTSRGATCAFDAGHLLKKLTGGSFVQRVDFHRAQRIVLFRKGIVRRFFRDCLVKNAQLQSRRRAVRSIITSTKQPSRKLMHDLKSCVDRHPVRSFGELLQLDTTFCFSNFYLTIMVYRSRIFKRRGKNLTIPLAFLLHKNRRATDYSFLFDALNEEFMDQFPGKHTRSLPYLVSDGCRAISQAVKDSSLFNNSQHILCFVHITRNLQQYLKAAGKSDEYIKKAKRVVLGNDHQTAHSRTRVLCALDVDPAHRKEFVTKAMQSAAPSYNRDLNRWLNSNKDSLDKVSLSSRIGSQDSLDPLDTNLVEGMNQDLNLIVKAGTDTLYSIEQLEEYSFDLERQLLESAAGNHPELTSLHKPDNQVKYCGLQQIVVLEGRLSRATFDKLCQMLSHELLTEVAEKAKKLQISMVVVDELKFACVFPKADIVDFGKGTCTCSTVLAYCVHMSAALESFATDVLVHNYLDSLSNADCAKIRNQGVAKGEKSTRRTGVKTTRNRAQRFIATYQSPEITDTTVNRSAITVDSSMWSNSTSCSETDRSATTGPSNAKRICQRVLETTLEDTDESLLSRNTGSTNAKVVPLIERNHKTDESLLSRNTGSTNAKVVSGRSRRNLRSVKFNERSPETDESLLSRNTGSTNAKVVSGRSRRNLRSVKFNERSPETDESLLSRNTGSTNAKVVPLNERNHKTDDSIGSDCNVNTVIAKKQMKATQSRAARTTVHKQALLFDDIIGADSNANFAAKQTKAAQTRAKRICKRVPAIVEEKECSTYDPPLRATRLKVKIPARNTRSKAKMEEKQNGCANECDSTDSFEY